FGEVAVKPRMLSRVAGAAVCLAVSVILAGRIAAQQPEELPSAPGSTSEGEGHELLRGPIHEAFAKPVHEDAELGSIAPEQPPNPIEEIPPEVKPEGENVIWIPGYWMWDPVEKVFFWVSGVWRAPPPEMRWVPGYWTEAPGGWQWISGFWTPIETAQVEYLPAPPESLERGPTSPAPSPTHFWVTGCWIYRDGVYAWRPGYWSPYYEGWVWVPAHYVWTPRGVVFCDGYWDYTLVRRGQCFAPVYFQTPVYRRPAYTYTPRVAIDISRALLHLFVNPGGRHYYFGDYYQDHYRNLGYYSWSDYYAGARRYDPVFAYYRTYYQVRGVDYAQRLQAWRTYFERHEEYRPPRTFQAQAELASRLESDDSAHYALLGRTLRELTADARGDVRFEQLADERRHGLAESAGNLQELVRERLRVEGEAAAEADAPQRGEVRERGGIAGRLRLPDAPRFPDVDRGKTDDAVGDARRARPPVRRSDEDAPTENPPVGRDAPSPRPDRAPREPGDASPGVDIPAGDRPDAEHPKQPRTPDHEAAQPGRRLPGEQPPSRRDPRTESPQIPGRVPDAESQRGRPSREEEAISPRRGFDPPRLIDDLPFPPGLRPEQQPDERALRERTQRARPSRPELPFPGVRPQDRRGEAPEARQSRERDRVQFAPRRGEDQPALQPPQPNREARPGFPPGEQPRIESPQAKPEPRNRGRRSSERPEAPPRRPQDDDD
ncbi:MAG: YXWGXW repeat-containing protein, partial [Planctomycetes bacterium]|nr:YXWGXW repeat-containing protein [Planctomycetota bacterium]